ncbi:hypothetical protein [Yeosuana marina]|uniref:hypothetical protein n=1 Tax=Yeosuana marina TaxID=1565536 RepID=UPI0030ED6D81|tara:strand:+ start:408 stop:797 length:390 start_codon:yes stop_codon:yes gene_type:complete
MTKKTINISQKIISSIILGFLLSLTIVIVGHFYQDDWTAMPISSNRSVIHGGSIPMSMAAPVSWCSYKCIFGDRHMADCIGKNLSNFSESNPNVLSASFEHLPLIFIIGLILSIIIYLLKTVSINVTNE